MTQTKETWQLAQLQAKQVKKLKHQESRKRQIVLLCETLKKALGGVK